MSTARKGIYEAMFVVGAEAAGANWEQVVSHIRELLKKRGAEIRFETKWDERTLTYPIRRQIRGVYYWVYFEAPRGEMAALRRDCALSETILRVLFLAQETPVDYSRLQAMNEEKMALIKKMVEERVEEEEDGEGRRRHRDFSRPYSSRREENPGPRDAHASGVQEEPAEVS